MRPVALVALALVVLAPAAQAHPNLQNAMWVQFEPALVRVAVNVSLKEISVAQGVPIGETAGLDLASLGRAAERHGAYLSRHLTVSAGPEVLGGKIIKVVPPQGGANPEQEFYQYELEYLLGGPPPGEITFSHDMLAEWPYAAGIPWDVTYVVRTKRYDRNEIASWLLTSRQAVGFPTGWDVAATSSSGAAKAGGWRTFVGYLRHGAVHILAGYDHLLFVAALVIATLGPWEMAGVIAAFTLAHTLTLAFCVFGIFRLPTFVVEPLIALSIVFVALENVFRPQRAHSRLRLAVAFGFGLVHGMGFAGGLRDAMAGLPPAGTWIALGAFSVGVELGHQVVVLPLFGLVAYSRHRMRGDAHPSLPRYGSAVISCCGAYYLFVALHQQFLSR